MLVFGRDEEFGLAVVDPAKDPVAAGPLARFTTRNSHPDKALVRQFQQLTKCRGDTGRNFRDRRLHHFESCLILTHQITP